MSERITDLDKFVRDHIKKPYQNHDDVAPEIEKLRLDNVMDYIFYYHRWWALVSRRIAGIRFRFPDYIQHPLVDVIKGLQDE